MTIVNFLENMNKFTYLCPF